MQQPRCSALCFFAFTQFKKCSRKIKKENKVIPEFAKIEFSSSLNEEWRLEIKKQGYESTINLEELISLNGKYLLKINKEQINKKKEIERHSENIINKNETSRKKIRKNPTKKKLAKTNHKNEKINHKHFFLYNFYFIYDKKVNSFNMLEELTDKKAKKLI